MRSDQIKANSASETSLDKRHLLSGEREFDCETQALLPASKTENKSNTEDEQIQRTDEPQNAEYRSDMIVLLLFWFVILFCGGAILAELLYLDSRN